MEQGFLNRSNKTSLKKDGKKGSLLGDLVGLKVRYSDLEILVNRKDVCEAGSSKLALVDTENNYVVVGATSVLSRMPTIDVGSEVMGINTHAHKDVVDLTLADVIIPQDEVDTLSMESVLEQGPWRIRSVPLILNMWNPNSDLKKEDIKKVPVWVKLFNVPVVAYSKVGLTLITAKLGRLLMLDAHTSNMCLNSWGMNSYARALVEISADNEFVESLVVAVPIAKTKGHRLVSIDIEFEYKPPRCSACKIFDHVDKECHKKEKVEMGKSSMDVGLVHGKRNSKIESVDIKKTTKGTHQGSTSKYKAGFKFPKGKPILVYRPVAKPNASLENASIQQDNSSLASREGVNVACDKPSDSSNLRNNMNKLVEEEKVLDFNTQAFTSVDDGMAMDNGRLGECSKVAKEAATMASSKQPKLSFGDLNLTNISDSDEEEVFASNEEFEAYLSSVGGGNQLEEEFDLYDDDYADQTRDLPGQIKEFHDFQLLNSGRK
ncbi:zinc knuckle CX2CX4HX4C containing protein [Tanacetum coccineum]